MKSEELRRRFKRADDISVFLTILMVKEIVSGISRILLWATFLTFVFSLNVSSPTVDFTSPWWYLTVFFGGASALSLSLLWGAWYVTKK